MSQETKTPAEFETGGTWGDAINWVRPEQFNGPQPVGARYDVVGWKTPMPQVGDTLKGEFQTSWIWFTFVEIEPCGDPHDMFFGKVQFLKQDMKEKKDGM